MIRVPFQSSSCSSLPSLTMSLTSGDGYYDENCNQLLLDLPQQQQQGHKLEGLPGSSSSSRLIPPTSTLSLAASSTIPPTGRWKDGIFSCWRLGLLHPHLWNAWLCPQMLLGQILVRMSMMWLVYPTQHQLNDHPSSNHPHQPTKMTCEQPQQQHRRKRCVFTIPSTSKPSSSTLLEDTTTTTTTTPHPSTIFRKITILMVLLSLYDAMVSPPLFEVQLDPQSGVPQLVSHVSDLAWHQGLYLLSSVPMSIWGIWVMICLRRAVRKKYGIATGRLGQYEDCVCVTLCGCCVLSQLARQTADFEGQDRASCCSSNGIDPIQTSTTTKSTTITTTTTSATTTNAMMYSKTPNTTMMMATTTTTTTFSPTTTDASTTLSMRTLSFRGCTRRKNSKIPIASVSVHHLPSSSSSSSSSSSLPPSQPLPPVVGRVGRIDEIGNGHFSSTTCNDQQQ
jgi:hypothetical protein